MNKLIHDFSHQVLRNWSTLKEGNEHSQQWLTRRFLSLYRSINSHHEFQKMLNTDDFPLDPQKGYLWSSLYEHENCRLGLLHILAGSKIPLHDHGDCIGVSIVLKGNPIISHYDLPEKSGAFISRLNEENSTKLDAKTGGLSYIFPQKSNIHGFSSSSQSDSTLLNILIQKERTEKRYCYLPPLEHYTNHPKSRSLMKCIGHAIMINLLSMNISIASCNENTVMQKVDQAVSQDRINRFHEQCKYINNTLLQFRIADKFKQKGGYDAAYLWYLKSAEGGDSAAQFELAMMLLDGLGVTDDAYEALEWLAKSSANGHQQANEVFAYLLENPDPLDC